MKEKMNFPNLDSLQPVVNVINEAAITLGDPTRTIKDSPLIEVFSAAIGTGSGTGVSFLALYGLGTVIIRIRYHISTCGSRSNCRRRNGGRSFGIGRSPYRTGRSRNWACF